MTAPVCRLRFLVVLVSLLALGLVPSVAAAQRPLPTLNYGGRFGVRPKVFDGWAADGSLLGGPSSNPPLGNYPNGSFGHITWTLWNRHRASGSGIVWYNDCRPSCGNGHWHSEPRTRVEAHRPRGGHFIRLSATVAYAGRRRHIVFAYVGNVAPPWTPPKRQ